MKPRLTARIVRGLAKVYAQADVNLFDGSDLYTGCSDAEQKEVDDAVAWLGSLLFWWDNNHPRQEK